MEVPQIGEMLESSNGDGGESPALKRVCRIIGNRVLEKRIIALFEVLAALRVREVYFRESLGTVGEGRLNFVEAQKG